MQKAGNHALGGGGYTRYQIYVGTKLLVCLANVSAYTTRVYYDILVSPAESRHVYTLRCIDFHRPLQLTIYYIRVVRVLLYGPDQCLLTINCNVWNVIVTVLESTNTMYTANTLITQLIVSTYVSVIRIILYISVVRVSVI